MYRRWPRIVLASIASFVVIWLSAYVVLVAYRP